MGNCIALCVPTSNFFHMHSIIIIFDTKILITAFLKQK